MKSSAFYEKKWQDLSRRASALSLKPGNNELGVSYLRYRMSDIYSLMLDARNREEALDFERNKRKILAARLNDLSQKENHIWTTHKNEPEVAIRLTKDLVYKRERIEAQIQRMGITWNELYYKPSPEKKRKREDDDSDSDDDTSDEEEKKVDDDEAAAVEDWAQLSDTWADS